MTDTKAGIPLAQEKSIRGSLALSSARSGQGARARVWFRTAWAGALVASAWFGGCSSSHGSGFGSGGSSSSNNDPYGTGGGASSSSHGPLNLAGGGDDGGSTGASCAAGINAKCTQCPDGGQTTISGTVYDPAGVNPVYNVTVFVPEGPLPDLSTVGVQGTLDGGAPFCACDGFYPPILADAVTDVNGHFTIPNAPGGVVTLVVQTGKWRMVYPGIDVAQCTDNVLPDKSLRLPRNSKEGDLPDIAIATGAADTLECLPRRMGVDSSEYVGGSGSGGHIHIFQGYNGAQVASNNLQPELGLWDTANDLAKNDVVLFSCEGRETVSPNQAALVDYANRGGRAFLSHYHYAWLRDAPASSKWPTLASWQGDNMNSGAIDDNSAYPGDIDTALGEGATMQQWLALTGGLTAGPASGNALEPPAAPSNCPDCAPSPAAGSGQVPIYQVRANVTSLNSALAHEWIHIDPSVTAAPVGFTAPAGGATQYFSFDTPLGAASNAESKLCGRVVYSDLHVSGGPGVSQPPGCTGNPPSCYLADYVSSAGNGTFGGNGGPTMKGGTAPDGCSMRELSPQEKVLEFMLFDLSSCLVPATSTGTIMPPPITR